MASSPPPTPTTRAGFGRFPVAFSSRFSPSSLARTTTAAPSLITQMSSMVRGQATISDLRTSSMVIRFRFWA